MMDEPIKNDIVEISGSQRQAQIESVAVDFNTGVRLAAEQTAHYIRTGCEAQAREALGILQERVAKAAASFAAVFPSVATTSTSES